MTDLRAWLRAVLTLAASVLVWRAATWLASRMLAIRDRQVIANLESRGIAAPDAFRAAWSEWFADRTFGTVVVAVFLLGVVAAGSLRSRRWLVPLIGTAGVLLWSVVTWWQPACGVPWPGPVGPENHWWFTSGSTLDVALAGPAALVVAFWLAYASTWGSWGVPRAQPRVRRDMGLAVAAPLSAIWVGASAAVAVVLSVGADQCQLTVPPWWLVLLTVPVAAMASGRGGPDLVLLTVAFLLLGLDAVRDAATTGDARPALALVMTAAAMLGAYAWRFVARGITVLQV